MSNNKHKRIELPFGIVVTMHGKEGSIVSEMKDYVLDYAGINCSEHVIDTGVQALEAMILQHATRGMNITSQKYIKGIEVALSKIAILS